MLEDANIDIPQSKLEELIEDLAGDFCNILLRLISKYATRRKGEQTTQYLHVKEGTLKEFVLESRVPKAILNHLIREENPQRLDHETFEFFSDKLRESLPADFCCVVPPEGGSPRCQTVIAQDLPNNWQEEQERQTELALCLSLLLVKRVWRHRRRELQLPVNCETKA